MDYRIKITIWLKNGVELETIEEFESPEQAKKRLKKRYEHIWNVAKKQTLGMWCVGNLTIITEQVAAYRVEDITEYTYSDDEEIESDNNEIDDLLKGAWG